ncbi:MAG TPA: class I SAM-dependent methyltransferase [Euzebyales bacterium]|nr:class I SAM-dependent methyltransferase [Euzebyales bacterium]
MGPGRDEYDDAALRRVYDGKAASYRWASLVNDTLFGAARLRRWVMTHARGEVLDVACGTGENFGLLRGVDSLTAVDLSPAMLDQARARAGRLGLAVDLLEMSAQQLDFPDGAFETVTTAMSTCTFPDPVGALREMARVTRLEGRLLLVEHGRSRVDWIARVQDRRADRHYRRTGCRSNQDVTAVLTSAGLCIDATRTRTTGVFTAIVAHPPEPTRPG